MPTVELNGIRLSYRVHGKGPLVVFVMGTGSPGRVWEMYQVPALVKAGYTAVTFENRGIAPSDECAAGFTIDDMVEDTAALIEHLAAQGHGPACVVGTSLGSRITQELCLARPDLVKKAVLLTAHGRMDPVIRSLSQGEREIYDKNVSLPPSYQAAVNAIMNLSPATLRDDQNALDWLAIIEYSTGPASAGVRAQMGLSDFPSRVDAYRSITVPVLAVGYLDDRLIPPHLAREVADAIPGARYAEVRDAGHYGALEQPGRVNSLILEFLSA
ncbi:alpha/beta fold hydrolase [Hoyosella subflava]|uniref:Alpha/beta hydrolase fold protein n=1 Tax=Hoyosella subflava (strain DSM 45089 / JCM 17490 / NBRC 109087 / DQS3-9A1) TaxID=443218 RepID=F6EHX3_HOYSD|nr:alpha/beta hydrolase [Hoyosella subflava]AEF38921.1 Alpha/beta hydrolase fold protein [Hoyosella subflava DQS3-9A1]